MKSGILPILAIAIGLLATTAQAEPLCNFDVLDRVDEERCQIVSGQGSPKALADALKEKAERTGTPAFSARAKRVMEIANSIDHEARQDEYWWTDATMLSALERWGKTAQKQAWAVVIEEHEDEAAAAIWALRVQRFRKAMRGWGSSLGNGAESTYDAAVMIISRQDLDISHHYTILQESLESRFRDEIFKDQYATYMRMLLGGLLENNESEFLPVDDQLKKEYISLLHPVPFEGHLCEDAQTIVWSCHITETKETASLCADTDDYASMSVLEFIQGIETTPSSRTVFGLKDSTATANWGNRDYSLKVTRDDLKLYIFESVRSLEDNYSLGDVDVTCEGNHDSITMFPSGVEVGGQRQ